MKKYLLILLTLLAQVSYATEYLGRDLSSWPQTESRKVIKDFGAWLLITPDLDWRQKWDTPPDAIPRFTEANDVVEGEQLVILTFFTNPGVDSQGNSYLKCTIVAERPDGSRSIPKHSFDCLNGELIGNPRYIRMSPAVIQFTAEKDDPIGVWTVWVTLEDVIKEITISLKASYTYVGKNN